MTDNPYSSVDLHSTYQQSIVSSASSRVKVEGSVDAILEDLGYTNEMKEITYSNVPVLVSAERNDVYTKYHKSTVSLMILCTIMLLFLTATQVYMMVWTNGQVKDILIRLSAYI